jgi:hypothetical protein
MGAPRLIRRSPLALPMHPDQFTPDDHRTQEPDSVSENQAPPAAAPVEQEQEAAGEGGEPRTTEVRTPEPDGARLGEAGNAYTGRQMDDDLKTTPRTDDAGDAAGDGTDDEG